MARERYLELTVTYQKIEVERRSPHLGAFIEAVDLSAPLDDATVAEIRAALLEFGVVFFVISRSVENSICNLRRVLVKSRRHIQCLTVTSMMPA